MQVRKFGYLLLGCICFLNCLNMGEMYAENRVDGNIIDLGVVREYKVKTDEVQYISREYSKAEEFKKGKVIKAPGTYVVRLKEADKVIKFEIPEKADLVVKNDEEFIELLRYALGEMKEEISFRIAYEYDKQFTNPKQKIGDMLNEALFKYPLLLYTGGRYNKDGNKLKLTFEYPLEKEKGLKAIEDIEEGLMDYVEQLDLTKSDIELQKEIIYDILDYVDYNDYSADVEDIPLSHHVQGLLDENNELVCDGYSRTFMMVANTLGIPTQIIRGKTVNGTNHAWNIVTHNKKTYHVDLTWADSDYRVSNYVNYVNETDSYMEKTHIWNKEKYPVCDSTEFLNTKIYDFVSLEEISQNKGLDFKRSFKVDVGVNNVGKLIANAYGDAIEYIKLEKYGQRIVTVLNEKVGRYVRKDS